MKTNNTVINSIMNKYMKYLCAVLLAIGTSAHAWATTETLDFAQCWGIGSSAYENGTYSFGGYAIEGISVKYNTYSPEHLMLNYYRENDAQRNAWGSVILPHFSGVISSIQVSTPSNSGSGTRTIQLYVNGVLQATSSGIAAGSSYTFTSLSIAAGSTVELRNNTANNEFHLSSIVVTHNGSKLGQDTPADGTIAVVVDGCGTVAVGTNPVARDGTSTLTATPASGWTFDYWEITTTQGLCQSWQYEQNEFSAGNVSPNNTSATTVTLTNNTYAAVFKVVAHFVETTCTKTPTITFTTSGTIEKKVGADVFTNAATVKYSGSATGQTITYSSSNESIAYVDDATGEVLVADNAVGSATITASVVESGDYCAQSASYTVNVSAYTVTYHYPACAASTPANASNVLGSHSLPTNMGVDGYRFAGWTDHAVTTNPSSVSPLYTSSVTVNADMNLYAVYTKTSSTFTLVDKGTANPTSGEYVIVSSYSQGVTKVLTTDIDSKYKIAANKTDYSITEAKTLSCQEEECIWTIAAVSGGFTIRNNSTGKYLASASGDAGSSDQKLRLESSTGTYTTWSISRALDKVPFNVINNKRNTDGETRKNLMCSGDYYAFYSSGTSPYLFKRASSSGTYTTNPDCNAAEYTVTFNLASAPTGATVTASATGATFSSPVLAPVTSGTAVTINATAPTGYHFVSWTVTSGGASLSSAATSASNGFTMPASNVVLTPVYAADSYTINYLDKGGSAFSGTHDTGYPATHTYGTETTLSGATKSGWEFAGWYTTSTCTSGTQVTSLGATDYTSSPTLYALWVHFTDPLAWCPEPEVVLTGTTYITSLYHASNEGMIRGTSQLTLTGRNMGIDEDVTLTSNNPDVYFSTSTNENIKRGAENQPKTSLTLKTDANGKLNGDEGYTIYVHFMPSAAGTGSVSDVTVTATYAVPDPDEVSNTHVYVRSMPAQFAVATKVGNTWYALPANMSGAGNPAPVQIKVNETNWTAKGPATVSYAMWPVHTSSSITPAPSYTANGDHWRLVGNSDKALWASPTTETYTLNNNAKVTAVGSTATTSYEWKITTTPLDALDPTAGTWKYYIQSDQTNNTNYLNIKNNDIVWGAYNAGYELTKDMYLLPLTPVEPFEYSVIEWYPTKMLIQTEATISSPTITIDGTPVASPTVTAKGSKWYEIGNLPLESNPAKTLTITNGGAMAIKTIPVIISRGTKTISDAPFSTLGKAVYNQTDLVVRDGAVLTVNGSATDNTFHDVTIHSNSKISVPALNTSSAENKLGVHSLTFFGGIDEIYDGSTYTVNKYGVPELSLKGKFGTKTITKIDYVMRVDASQMYSLTVPYDVDLSDITYWDGTAMSLGSQLWVSAYDGQARANKDMNHTWIYETDFASKLGAAKLKQGVGYTISARMQPNVGSTYSIIRMPMKSNVGSNATELAKTVPVTAYVNTQGVTVGDNNKGWNLVGNPYMVSISGGEPGSQLVVGKLVESGTGPWDWDGTTYPYRYVTIPFDDGSDYYQMKFKDATLRPFKNFFVQIDNTTEGNALGFALASRQNAPARYLQVQDREVEFEILLSNDSRQDNMGLLIADQYSPAYEINADLEKMIGAMSVYTIYGGYNLAYNALSPDDAKTAIPVGYTANVAGTYTFSLAEGNVDDVEHIWLQDYELERLTDLKDATYEFTTVKGKNETRFALIIELKKKTDITTDIRDIETDGDGPTKFIYHDQMYILLNGVIYDATGKKVREINK